VHYAPNTRATGASGQAALELAAAGIDKVILVIGKNFIRALLV
jgi:hypothetical protein